MEENVALDSSKQRKFVKSIKSIKKLIKKKDAAPKPVSKGDDKIKEGRVTKRKRKERGLVYLSHIPHGFYEHEMAQYFKQFGVVTNARVIRSKCTGKSKGYAFVEFKEPAVAEIVADTMNNYLMGKRLIKAASIPSEKQRRAFRKHWNSINNPGNIKRIQMKKAHNEDKDEQGELKRARQLLSNIRKTKKKLGELGIDYDFFTPVDIPKAILNNVEIKTENSKENESKKNNTKGTELKSLKKTGKVPVKVEDGKENIVKSEAVSKKKNKKGKSPVEEQKPVLNQSKGKASKIDSAVVAKQEKPARKLKKETESKSVVIDKKAQKQKKESLKSKGVTPLEDFIKVEQDEDSDSSADFDSDEFERLLNNDSGDDDVESSDDDQDSDNDEDIKSEESEEELPKKKNKVTPKVTPVPGKNLVKVHKKQPQGKRTAIQKSPAPAQAPKKSKFSKPPNQTQRSKQFKKKK